MSRQAIANIASVVLFVLVVLRATGGGGVLPIPIPVEPPIDAPGLHVLMVYESGELSDVSRGQQTVLFSTEIRNWLDANCKTDNDWPGWRVLDQDTDMSQDLPHWKAAMGRKRDSLPWIVVSADNGGFEGPLPDSIPAALELLRRYGG